MPIASFPGHPYLSSLVYLAVVIVIVAVAERMTHRYRDYIEEARDIVRRKYPLATDEYDGTHWVVRSSVTGRVLARSSAQGGAWIDVAAQVEGSAR